MAMIVSISSIAVLVEADLPCMVAAPPLSTERKLVAGSDAGTAETGLDEGVSCDERAVRGSSVSATG